MTKYRTDTCTIYKLTNKINLKAYIGQTWATLEKRMGDGENYKNSTYLYNAIKSHGAENFEYIVLATCEDQETANTLETQYIVEYNTRDHAIGYNLKEGGSAGKHSDETKQKISNSLKGENAPWFGKHLTEIAKTRISETKMGTKQSEEQKQAKAAQMTEWHATHVHPMTGKHHTEDAKKSMSDKLTGRKQDPEVTKKVADKNRMDPAREKSICDMYKAKTHTIKQMMAHFKTSQACLYRVFERNNIELRGGQDHNAGKKRPAAANQKQSESMKLAWAKRKAAKSST